MGIKIQQHNAQDKNTSSSFQELMKKDVTFFGTTFNSKRKEDFYTELSVLLTAGITLSKALDLMEGSLKKNELKLIVADINRNIVAGKSLFEILQANKHFTPYEFYAIKIGEQTGKLAEVTSDLALFFKDKNEQRRQVISALSYPIIVLLTAMAVVSFMMWYIVPMFVGIFKQRNVELPAITRWVINLSNFLTSYGWLLFIISLSLFAIFKSVKKQDWVKIPLDNFKIKIPLFGHFIKKVYITQFTHTMALLTKARVPVVNALGMVREMIQFHPLQKVLLNIENDIAQGARLSDSFSKHPLFDKKMIALLKVAEETNQTEFVFNKLKEQYSAELKYRSQMITAILNPIFLIIIAIIVGVILIAMYLPMFKLSSIIE